MVSFAEFLEANKVFADDGRYCNGTPMVTFSPWDAPVKWQDGLTQLPGNVDEQTVIQILSEIDTIVVSCTDKDMIYETWEMEIMGGTRKVWTIAVAGGVVQPEGERAQAMKTMADYLFGLAQEGKMPRLGRVLVMSHNEVCGAIKSWNHDECLVDLVRRVVGKEAQKREFEENTLMTALSRTGASVWLPFKMVNGVMFDLALYDLQRDGQGKKPKIKLLTADGFSLTVNDLQDADKINKILK